MSWLYSLVLTTIFPVFRKSYGLTTVNVHWVLNVGIHQMVPLFVNKPLPLVSCQSQ